MYILVCRSSINQPEASTPLGSLLYALWVPSCPLSLRPSRGPPRLVYYKHPVLPSKSCDYVNPPPSPIPCAARSPLRLALSSLPLASLPCHRPFLGKKNCTLHHHINTAHDVFSKPSSSRLWFSHPRCRTPSWMTSATAATATASALMKVCAQRGLACFVDHQHRSTDSAVPTGWTMAKRRSHWP